MLIPSALVTILALPAHGSLASGGQIPAADGVNGGVFPPGAHNFKNRARDVSGNALTPPMLGRLHIVENSGLCGEPFCLLRIPFHIHTLRRNYTGCLSGFRIW